MKLRKGVVTIVIAILVVALLVGLLMWQRREPPAEDEYGTEQEAPPPQSRRLVERTEDEIVKVVFESQYGSHAMIPFEDENGDIQWKQEGIDYVLNLTSTRHNIRAAFSIFSLSVVHEDINDVPGLNLDDFGFNQLVMSAHYDDGTTLNVYLGGPTIDFRGYFIMVEGDPALYVTAATNAERMLFGLEDMLDTTLPIWDAESIDFFFLSERGRDPIEFARIEHEEFEGFTQLTMVEPFEGAEVFATGFEHHVMEQFAFFHLGDLVNLHADDLTPYGLDDPSLELIYRAPHGEAHLLFGDIFVRETGGEAVAFIYVMFAGRPHVFEAQYEPLRVMFGMNPLQFISRFIALVNIQGVGQIYVSTPDADFEININHVPDANNIIEPTINGITVNDSDFRTVYRLLIGLGIDYEIEPFVPTEPPLYTFRYAMLEEDDIELRLYAYDGNFHAVSVNGEEIWFVVSRRNVELFISNLQGLMQE